MDYWASDAACLEIDPRYFFSTDDRDLELAKSCCDGCVVRAECLDQAIELNYEYGVWAGLTAHLGEIKRYKKSHGLN